MNPLERFYWNMYYTDIWISYSGQLQNQCNEDIIWASWLETEKSPSESESWDGRGHEAEGWSWGMISYIQDAGWMDRTLILADHWHLTLDTTGIAPVTLNGGNSAACSTTSVVTSNNVHTSAADKIIIAATINIYWLGSANQSGWQCYMFMCV